MAQAPVPKAPVIVLVRPQLVENIGTTARAMANCALDDLRLVAPRDPWPLGSVHQTRMAAAASGADDVLKGARVFDSVAEAVADLQYVYATTARPHDLAHVLHTPRSAAADMRTRTLHAERVGVLFGPERTGLVNEDLVRANAVITAPLNPAFMSLNLAQAVLMVAYEWRMAGDTTPAVQIQTGASVPAAHGEVENFFRRLESELDAAGFFVAPSMRPTMTKNLRAFIGRAVPTDQEIRTWHGVLSALVTGPRRGKE